MDLLLALPLLHMVLHMCTFKAYPYLFSFGAQLTCCLSFVSYLSSLNDLRVLFAAFISGNWTILFIDSPAYFDPNKPR
jgi:hypothetical protein